MKRATEFMDDNWADFGISIHALVKRATGITLLSDIRPIISIHALVKRATMYKYIFLHPMFYFNPRPREEGDTHTGTDTLAKTDFNPRPREEGDIAPCGSKRRAGNFNPRPREEGDIDGGTVVSAVDDFNPRPREEGDRQFCKNPPYRRISIHALVKRATNIGVTTSQQMIISIHALVKRATIFQFINKMFHVISIHALVKRATSVKVGDTIKINDFNPRPREEGDVTSVLPRHSR